VLFVPQRFLRQMGPIGHVHLTGHVGVVAHAWGARALHWREMVVLAMVAPSLLHVARVAKVVEGVEAVEKVEVEGVRAAE
jgi:hypothetical protein